MTKSNKFVRLSFTGTMKKFISRELYKKQLERYLGKDLIKVLIGQRRVGKSYLLLQVMDYIKEQYPFPNIIYINLGY
jgi:predicted AAA+ superfamily ATPase